MNKYKASEGLLQSLKVAQMLNRPLLLTGEPGTGKTKFADFVKSGANPENPTAIKYDAIEKFYTKSTSLSQDLFYEFDSIAYFASKQLGEQKPVSAFIYLKSLGKAICNAIGKETVTQKLKSCTLYNLLKDEEEKEKFITNFVSQVNLEPTNSIVLIDEIDKAPRDFPNDVLNEIDEGYKFYIKELDLHFALTGMSHILVIITSNFEKNLPEPFLRRCVFFNIDFPGDEDLLEIVCLRHYPDFCNLIKYKTITQMLEDKNLDKGLHSLITQLQEIITFRNNLTIIKKPSTSEILDFFYCLKAESSEIQTSLITTGHRFISTLFKRKEDLSKIPTPPKTEQN